MQLINSISAPKEIDGCPSFAKAYLGRKRRAQPIDRFKLIGQTNARFKIGKLTCNKDGGAPYLARFSRDAPNFLQVALDNTAYAPFFKERRIRFAEPTNLHRKLGDVGYHGFPPAYFEGPGNASWTPPTPPLNSRRSTHLVIKCRKRQPIVILRVSIVNRRARLLQLSLAKLNNRTKPQLIPRLC